MCSSYVRLTAFLVFLCLFVSSRPALSEHPVVVRVAAVQMLPAEANLKANVERADRLLKQTIAQGANIVCFPECALTGYSYPKKGVRSLAENRELAETVPGPSVNHFAKRAKEYGVYIIWCLHERDGDEYYNTAVLLGPGGEVLGKYRKVHINRFEKPAGFTNGRVFTVWPVTVDDVRLNLGIMICYDREMPEAARTLAVLGADVIFVPQATSCTCDIPIHRDQLRVRAYENECFIVMTNWAGAQFKGHSMIIHPQGETLKLGARDEDILFADLNLSELRTLRKNGIYGRHHRRPNVYGPLIGE